MWIVGHLLFDVAHVHNGPAGLGLHGGKKHFRKYLHTAGAARPTVRRSHLVPRDMQAVRVLRPQVAHPRAVHDLGLHLLQRNSAVDGLCFETTQAFDNVIERKRKRKSLAHKFDCEIQGNRRNQGQHKKQLPLLPKPCVLNTLHRVCLSK
jgi:hypothetical protein